MTGAGSPALNSPVLSAERRALRLAQGNLMRIQHGAEAALAHMAEGRNITGLLEGIRDRAARSLADIRALVPDAGEPRR